MADIWAFWDPADLGGGGERYDFSDYVAGRPGDENPEIGAPARLASRSESFLVAGVTIGHTHDSTRTITIPIGIKAASWDAAATIWEAIAAQLDVTPQALKMRLHNSAESLFFEVLPTSTFTMLYETWDQRPPATTIRARLVLECQPYPIGETSRRTFLGA